MSHDRRRKPQPYGWGYYLSALRACVVALSILDVPTLLAQPQIIRPALPAPRAAQLAAKAAVADDLGNHVFPGGAALKTDPEQQRLLQRAEQFAQEGRVDLAVVLWQKVLDEAGDTLMTRDGRKYTSLAEQVERTIAGLPPLALATYRTSADGEAQALIAAAGVDREEEALAKVVRRFFLSSQGDDAAYKLACLALDRHDFVGASRLLSKLLTSHPDPSIAKADILLRLAVAAAHMGDRQAAEQALNQLASVPGPRPTAEVVDAVAAAVKSASPSVMASSGAASRDWPLALGNPARTGHMPSLPAAATSRTLTELWVRDFSLATSQTANAPAARAGAAPGGFMVLPNGVGVLNGRISIIGPATQLAPVSREELINQWRVNGWRPTGRLLFEDGRVYLKTPDRLVCYSSAAHHDQPIWQSAWENHYELDGMSQQLAMMAMQMGWNLPQQASGKPKSPTEVLLFGDRVHQSLAMDDRVLYSLEGKRVVAGEPATRPANQPGGVGRGFQAGSTPRRTRGNWLTAYQASGGKALWTRSASDDDKQASADVGFLSAPVPCGGILLAPVTDGGTIWLFGLDRTTGKTLWKTYLCDEPSGGAAPWAETVVAVDGREAYVTCGCGVVFAVDAAVGSIRWAVRYQREGRPNTAMRMVYGTMSPTLELNGWDDDLAIPYGPALVVMSSDSDKLLALDRRTGDLLWESPRTSPFGSVANYCVGVHGRGLFVAGKNVVRRYDLVSGRLIWEKEIQDSFGRGCVSADALYLPIKDSILRLDLDRGRELSHVGVAMTSDEPVGNLFSDGEKLWVVGAARVYAMTTLEHRLTILADQIAAGSGEAQLNRMRLYFRANQPDLGLVDLRAAYALFQKQLPPDEAAKQILAAITELKLAQTRPIITLQLLTELFAEVALPAQFGREAESRFRDLAASSISVIRQKKLAGAIPVLLRAVPLLPEEYLLTAATHAVDDVATGEDAAALFEALEQGSAAARLISIRAAARIAPDDAKAPLAKLLKNSDDRVRLAAARTIVNLQERENVLETLLSLLESANPRIRARSHQTLQALTGQSIVFSAEAKPEERTAAVKAWQQWIETSGKAATWSLPLSDLTAPLGRTLLVSQGQSTITELDVDRKPFWQMRLPGPAWGCQGLPNGHRLVAIYSHSMVIEYDDSGKEVWRKDRLPAAPYSVQRLETGGTLVACPDANQIIDITPDGNTTITNVPGRPISAQRLESGNTLVALQQQMRVVEVDRTGQVVWEARTRNPPGHAVRLDNGNTLVSITNERKVVEYDPTGKNVVWASEVMLTNPYAAQRLSNGNTVVADHMGVHELDSTGKKIVNSLRQPQVTGLSSF